MRSVHRPIGPSGVSFYFWSFFIDSNNRLNISILSFFLSFFLHSSFLLLPSLLYLSWTVSRWCITSLEHIILFSSNLHLGFCFVFFFLNLKAGERKVYTDFDHVVSPRAVGRILRTHLRKGMEWKARQGKAGQGNNTFSSLECSNCLPASSSPLEAD